MSENLLTRKLGWKGIVASSVVSAYLLAGPVTNIWYHIVDSRNYTGCARQATIDKIYRAEIFIPGSCLNAEDKWREEWGKHPSADVGVGISHNVEVRTEKTDWHGIFK